MTLSPSQASQVLRYNFADKKMHCHMKTNATKLLDSIKTSLLYISVLQHQACERRQEELDKRPTRRRWGIYWKG